MFLSFDGKCPSGFVGTNYLERKAQGGAKRTNPMILLILRQKNHVFHTQNPQGSAVDA